MGRPRKPVASASLREMLAVALAQEGTQDSVELMIATALGAETGVKAECPECHHRFTAILPDAHKAAQTMALLIDRLETEEASDVKVIVMRPPR